MGEGAEAWRRLPGPTGSPAPAGPPRQLPAQLPSSCSLQGPVGSRGLPRAQHLPRPQPSWARAQPAPARNRPQASVAGPGPSLKVGRHGRGSVPAPADLRVPGQPRRFKGGRWVPTKWACPQGPQKREKVLGGGDGVLM